MKNVEDASDFDDFASESPCEAFWRPKSRDNRFEDVGCTA